MIKYEIKNCFTGDVHFVAEIDCSAGAQTPIKRRMAVLWALDNKAELRWANLSEADLRGSNLSEADLSGANLRCADLSGANLRGADFKQIIIYETPIIKRIHQKVAKAVQGGTKHCRAGWVIVLAGAAGEELEERLGTSAAAALIYAASDPDLKTVPNFHCSDDEALADILECAERERNLAAELEADR